MPLLTSLAGLLAGYALARGLGLCGPEGECLTWGILAATGVLEATAHEVAGLLLDTGDAGPGKG